MEIVCRSEAYRRFESSSLRHKKSVPNRVRFFVLWTENRRGFEGGSCERERAFCPRKVHFTKNLTAKQTIDNRLAGRAAKGENPLLVKELKERPN